MPTFLSLPNEILLDVMGYLYCEDIESVTFACKHIRRLAAPKILRRHLERKRRFGTVAVGQILVCGWFLCPSWGFCLGGLFLVVVVSQCGAFPLLFFPFAVTTNRSANRLRADSVSLIRI